MSLPGVIAGRFAPVKLAGAGGMGRVYRAKDQVAGGEVALKVLHPESLEVGRFDREAALLAELSHPGIVRYVAHGTTPSGDRWLAMEWLEGEDLSHRLDRQGLDLGETLTLGLRVAEALAEAHRRGVVHRDIKPGNLFLAGGDVERVKLLDFGVARIPRREALTSTGQMIGTPGYMAPEQIRGEKLVDARADVFALGCVIFRCLTGRPPFVEEGDVLGMLLKAMIEPAPRVRSLRPDLPGAVDDLIDRLLANTPDARPPDGAAVAAEIAHLQGGSGAPLSWRPPPSVGPVEERLRAVLVARAVATAALVDEVAIAALAERYGGTLHVLVDGSVVVTLAGTDAATDQAVRAARCALAFQAVLPGVPLALFAGRAALTSAAPTSPALDRGAAMLARAGAGGIALDDVIARLLDARFEVREDAEGRALLAERDLAEATRVLLGKPTPCVGRDAEIGRLLSHLDEVVAEPTARAVLVTAPAGAGKSRLTHELLARIRRERPEVEIWTGRGDPMSAGSPFAMLASALRRAAGVRAGDPPAARRARLAAHVGRHLSAADRRWVVPFVGEVAGVPFEDGGPELAAARHDPRLLGDQMRRAWLALLRAETEAAPLCLVLEDLHWGDAPSLGFVGAALRELSERPLFVLALARPDVHDAFPRLWVDRALVEVKLGPLSRRAVEKLVREALGQGASAEVVEAIVSRAGGNAFYVEELIRAVAEGRGDTWPETVLAMAEQRLDQLDPEARQVLRAASVFGPTFFRGGVTALLGGGPVAARAGDWLAELAAREVIEPRGEQRFPGEEAFAFRHALMRDAAYATLPEADRAAAHALAAAWLTEQGEDDALLLAEHFERGAQPARALGHYQRAAEQALEGDDLTGAVARVQKAIACGASGEALGALRVTEAEAHGWRGDLVAAERASTQALDLLPVGGARWCEAAGIAVMAHLQLGHVDRFTTLARTLFVVEPATDAKDRFALGAALVIAYLLTGGLYPYARTFMARARAVLAGAGGLARNPVARGWIGWAECLLVKYEATDAARPLRLAEEAVAALTEAGDVRGSIRVRMERGIALRALGRFPEAEAELTETLSLAERLGVRYLEAGSLLHLANTHLAQGRVTDALAAADRAAALYAGMGNAMVGGAARATRALAELAQGHLDAALASAEAAAAVVFTPPARALMLGVLSTIRLARGEIREALATSSEGMRILGSLGSIPDGEAGLRLVHAEALAASGRAEEAREVIGVAREKLRARASTIEDEAMRHRFLDGVDVHRRTMRFLDG